MECVPQTSLPPEPPGRRGGCRAPNPMRGSTPAEGWPRIRDVEGQQDGMGTQTNRIDWHRVDGRGLGSQTRYAVRRYRPRQPARWGHGGRDPDRVESDRITRRITPRRGVWVRAKGDSGTLFVATVVVPCACSCTCAYSDDAWSLDPSRCTEGKTEVPSLLAGRNPTLVQRRAAPG